MAIRIFITGGTFDKEYNELNGQLYFKDTHLQELLTMGRSQVSVEIRTLMMIDSLEMTDQDRELIAYQCNNSEEDRIVITHGTDTMAETAKVLADTLGVSFNDVARITTENARRCYWKMDHAAPVAQVA